MSWNERTAVFLRERRRARAPLDLVSARARARAWTRARRQVRQSLASSACWLGQHQEVAERSVFILASTTSLLTATSMQSVQAVKLALRFRRSSPL